MADGLAVLLHVPEFRRPRVDLRTMNLDARELPLDAHFLDSREGLLPDEVRLLFEVDEPPEVDLVRVVLERHVGAVVQDPRLDPSDLGGRDRPDVVLLARLHDPVPQLEASAPVEEIDLVPDL